MRYTTQDVYTIRCELKWVKEMLVNALRGIDVQRTRSEKIRLLELQWET
jgi:hypothetical protein